MCVRPFGPGHVVQWPRNKTVRACGVQSGQYHTQEVGVKVVTMLASGESIVVVMWREQKLQMPRS